ncbi:hypothetical protein T4B_2258 [Trichinella pseudospiralis]|uniref:Uncharacterized protein n=1 Tax=Trichinella pseudospiralis TaxID=6337 RepID=A0A0V1H8P6_TRIPS|nr:hypothetical protein T4B_2258 [Trichinella pseudospiralis]
MHNDNAFTRMSNYPLRIIWGGLCLFDVEKITQLMVNPRFEQATLVQVFWLAKQEGMWLSIGEVVRQDQNVSAPTQSPFKWSLDVHTDSLQRITCVMGCICARLFLDDLSLAAHCVL